MLISVSTVMLVLIITGLIASITGIVFIIRETGVTDKYTIGLTCCCAATTACLLMILVLYVCYYCTTYYV